MAPRQAQTSGRLQKANLFRRLNASFDRGAIMRASFLAICAAGLIGVSCSSPEPVASNAAANLEEVAAADHVVPAEAGSDARAELGEPVPVSSDSASYRLVRLAKMTNGNLEAVTRREGSSGVSFARREISCGERMFRYLGEGETLEQAEKDGPNPGDMGPLTDGSISTEVSTFVCGKAGRSFG